MSQINTEIYAQLAIKITRDNFDEPQNDYGSVHEIKDSNGTTSAFILREKVSTETGYQGYLYESVETGELYFVNGGSQTIPTSPKNFPEVIKDYYENAAKSP